VGYSEKWISCKIVSRSDEFTDFRVETIPKGMFSTGNGEFVISERNPNTQNYQCFRALLNFNRNRCLQEEKAFVETQSEDVKRQLPRWGMQVWEWESGGQEMENV
jgi:hypothetical protein